MIAFLMASAAVAVPATHKVCQPSGTVVGYTVACPTGTTTVQKMCPYGQIVAYSAKCPTTAPPPPPPPPPPPTPPPPPPPPVVWTHCANENQTCSLQSPANVRYGANGKYVTKPVVVSILCGNSAFGDPIFGTAKTCDTDGQVTPPPSPSPVPVPPPVVPPPAPIPTGLVVGAQVQAVAACQSSMNPADVLTIGATYTLTSFYGQTSLGSPSFGNPATAGVVLSDPTNNHWGDGWYAYFVPLSCVR